MSRPRLVFAALAVLAVAAAVAQLGAQPVAPAGADQVPRGNVSVTTADSPEAQRLRDVVVRTVGGRAFLVGAPGGRQLTETAPLVWIPVDVVVQMIETSDTR